MFSCHHFTCIIINFLLWLLQAWIFSICHLLLSTQAEEAGRSLGPHSLCPQPFENSTGLHLKRVLKAMMSPSAMGDICVCFTLGFLLRFR